MKLLLKKTLYKQLNNIDVELRRVEYQIKMGEFPNGSKDILLVEQSLLEKHKSELMEIIGICISRNKF